MPLLTETFLGTQDSKKGNASADNKMGCAASAASTLLCLCDPKTAYTQAGGGEGCGHLRVGLGQPLAWACLTD